MEVRGREGGQKRGKHSHGAGEVKVDAAAEAEAEAEAETEAEAEADAEVEVVSDSGSTASGVLLPWRGTRVEESLGREPCAVTVETVRACGRPGEQGGLRLGPDQCSAYLCFGSTALLE